jgi:hypothetical protein
MSVMFSAMPEKGGSNGEDSFENDTTSTLVNDDSDRTSVDGLKKKVSTSPISPRHMRRLSIPDMHMLKKAVDLRESVGDVEIPFGKLQVCIICQPVDIAFISLMSFFKGGLTKYANGRSCETAGDASASRSSTLLFTSK